MKVLEIKFSWLHDGTVELYRKEKSDPADIVVLSNPRHVAEFTVHFMDFLKREGSIDEDEAAL